jgi:hypothetical protein
LPAAARRLFRFRNKSTKVLAKSPFRGILAA